MHANRSKLIHVCFAMLLLTLSCTSAAQNFATTQVLRAPATGEGEAGGQFGARVALENGFAVVADLGSSERGTVLRAYQRGVTGSDWLPLPTLTRRVDDGGVLLDLALSDSRVVYSRAVGTVDKIEILDRVGQSWVV